ncbi:replication endonuclease [Thioalkalivibrio sp. ALE17]|uniref:replication endonuclease n=1 Tax=Thioalkalivibrio sp. ALE17 TaxID=1158173 RepID=UPI000411E98C|nr:replication endonuclease [Thioalkalivibrio sp. ALE17]
MVEHTGQISRPRQNTPPLETGFDIEGFECGWRLEVRPRRWPDGKTTIHRWPVWAPKGWDYPLDDLPHLEQCLRVLPKAWRPLCELRYRELLETKGRRNANLWLLDLGKQARRAPVNLSASDDALRNKGDEFARRCEKLTLAGARTVATDAGLCCSSAKSEEGELMRYRCDRWWRRQLRSLQLVAVEAIARELALVSRRKQIYVSDVGLQLVRQRNQRNRATLATMEAVNDLGDAFSLAELAERSVSNPKLRRNELMARIAGTEAHARSQGYRALFVTITCPSRFHATASQTGEANPSFDRSTPKDGATYLNKVWANVRRWFKDADIAFYGIRVREPQHDETPHDHYLLFTPPDQEPRVVEIMQEWALKDSPTERGARRHRFTVEYIDYDRGTATGYVAKYVSKNIDGYGLTEDSVGHMSDTAAQRVQAWSAVWRIRQFAFYGTQPVGIWRELRRTRGDADDPIRDAALAADVGDWERFTEALFRHPLRLLKVWSDELGAYGEEKGDQVLGVETPDASVAVQTRNHTWELRPVAGRP